MKSIFVAVMMFLIGVGSAEAADLWTVWSIAVDSDGVPMPSVIRPMKVGLEDLRTCEEASGRYLAIHSKSNMRNGMEGKALGVTLVFLCRPFDLAPPVADDFPGIVRGSSGFRSAAFVVWGHTLGVADGQPVRPAVFLTRYPTRERCDWNQTIIEAVYEKGMGGLPASDKEKGRVTKFKCWPEGYDPNKAKQ